MRRTFRRGAFVVACAATAYILLKLIFESTPNQTVGTSLRIEPPPSVTNAQCVSDAFTDIVTKCTFDIQNAEFQGLLEGWAFSEEVIDRSRLTQSQAELAPFPVSYVYHANPDQFPHGGHLWLAVNAEKTKVLLDLYIE